MRLWNVATGKSLRTVYEADESIHALSFNPSGTRLAVAASITLIIDPLRTGAISVFETAPFAERLSRSPH